MIVNKAIFILVICTITIISCSTLVSGFRELAPEKKQKATELYGSGKYYRFVAKGTELKNVDPEKYKQYGKEYAYSAFVVLVASELEHNKVCLSDYALIKNTLVHFEGGSASIFVRCVEK
jgi:aldehyde:ferredoxin oxidoreductase